MDGFNVPMLSESGYSSSSANPLQTHHHKDQMLSAGSAPATPYIYEIHNKIEGDHAKSDYAAFTNCIQQSALLDHRSGDVSIDAVSLSGLCDLKFPSPTATTTDTNFKNISLINIEANHVLVPSKSSTSDLMADVSVEPTFANILYSKESITIDPKVVQSCMPAQVLTRYLPIKATETESKFDKVSVTATGGAASTGALTATATVTSYDVISPASNHNSNNSGQKLHRNNVQILNNQITQHATTLRSDQVTVSDYLGGRNATTSFSSVSTATIRNCPSGDGNSKNHNDLNSSTENQITTTTSTTTNTSTASQIITNNIINRVSGSNKSNSASSSSSSSNNTSTTTKICNTASVASPTTATSSAVTRSRATVLQSVEEFAAASTSRTSAVIIATIPASEGCSNSNNSSSEMSSNNGSAAKELEQQKRQLNSSNLSTECDSQSSSDELDDLEIGDSFGYQDNASSHSQQSVSGGGGSNGGGGGGGGSSANVVLLNGGNGNASGGYMTLLPPATSSGHLGAAQGGTSASSGASGEVIDFKHLFEELCPVCGDKVSGYHYGLLTCESCKGFFKRTVQNKKVYTCVAERSCHIDKTQRKRCPFCRFQKCLEVGMKLEAVRADRMRGGRNKFGPMYKRDRARKLQVMRQRQLALQALRTSIGSVDMKPSPLSPGYQQAYPNMNIKQEIQIPQVSSLTQSPDSSPSPIAIALGQVNTSTGVISTPMNGGSGNGGGGGGGGGGGHGSGGGANNSNSSNTSDGINRGGNGNCHDTGTGSLQNASESKMCFDSGTHPSSTADSIIEPLRVSPMIRDFVQSIDDREWQTQLFALLQKQTYNQVEVDLFELMCKVLDQNLFSQVDWARNTVFFKDLKVDDQMKLLQHSWSDMLVLDHLHQRIHNGLPDETQLNNGQVFNLLWLGLLGVPQLSDYFNELQNRLQDLKFDMGDYVCMKFLILLNPDVRGIINKKTVLEGQDNVQAALLDYTLTCYPSVTDKFRRLLSILPDIHAMAARGEEHLYSKHCAGSAPTQTLLMEMLHAKRKV